MGGEREEGKCATECYLAVIVEVLKVLKLAAQYHVVFSIKRRALLIALVAQALRGTVGEPGGGGTQRTYILAAGKNGVFIRNS